MPMNPATSWVLLVWYRDDAAGLTTDFKDGDILAIMPGAVTVGNAEKLDWLPIRIPAPPNSEDTKEHWLQEQYAPGPSTEENVLFRKRQYCVANWRSKFTQEQITAITSSLGLPDGPNVVNGIVENLFTRADVHPK